MLDYKRLVNEARDGLNKERSDLAEEEQTFLGKIESGEIRTWGQLDGALIEPYEAILGDAVKEKARSAFLVLEQRTKRHLTPQDAGIFLAWHMHAASYMDQKEVAAYFSGLFPNQENHPQYRSS